MSDYQAVMGVLGVAYTTLCALNREFGKGEIEKIVIDVTKSWLAAGCIRGTVERSRTGIPLRNDEVKRTFIIRKSGQGFTLRFLNKRMTVPVPVS